MNPFEMTRLGMLMEPEPGNPNEVGGVLNPAAARGPDGGLYLFPRLVAKGNYSRIGIAKVEFDSFGEPTGVKRLGIALEPDADYEHGEEGFGGCEDPRVTFLEPTKQYVMAYTALSAKGPRIAFARSEDLFHWQRFGLATFDPYHGIEFDGVPNKDASVFPVAVPSPLGEASFALLHRPLFPGTRPEEKAQEEAGALQDLDRESIWISYRAIDIMGTERFDLTHFTGHHRLAAPVKKWECLKIGIGAPPILCKHGWLLVYHGVGPDPESVDSERKTRYSAGVMILDKHNPMKILYRSAEPVLVPTLQEETHGTVANVVFPTGIDRRDDLNMPDRFDVYYGMADNRIGVARIDVPAELPPYDEAAWSGPDSQGRPIPLEDCVGGTTK